jgi:hypothetical protein
MKDRLGRHFDPAFRVFPEGRLEETRDRGHAQPDALHVSPR